MNPLKQDYSVAARDVKLPRSAFRWDARTRTSFQEGALIPLRVLEVLPGDTFSGSVSALVRSVTPLFPVMDDAYLDIYFFFVPNRIIWSHWAEMMGENKTTKWDQPVEFILPGTADSGAIAVGSIADYIGYPVGRQVKDDLNLLPWVGYFKIWDEFFRDQNVSDPHAMLDVFFNLGSGALLSSSYAFASAKPLKCGKYHDYFTSCLPQPQKGDAVDLSLGDSAPLTINLTGAGPLMLDGPAGLVYGSTGIVNYANVNSPGPLGVNGGNNSLYYHSGISASGYANLSGATSASVNSVRFAFQLQKFLERDARHGTRYSELLKSHFGVLSSDARLQRPECLGGFHQRLGMSQVEQTAPTTGANLGEVGAYSVTGVSSQGYFTKSFEEHGYFFMLGVVRVKHTYSQGLPRFLSRKRKYDFYFPEFANIGEQPVYKKELWAGATRDDSVFGYQEAWADYRSIPSLATGLMRTGVTGSLGEAWTYGDKYSGAPSLNEAFIQEDASLMNRTLSVQSTEANPVMFKGDFNLSLTAVRVMPVYSIPGAIDHN